MGKAVTYNDSLQFNYLIGKALIENDCVLLSENEINFLVGPADNAGDGFVAATFISSIPQVNAQIRPRLSSLPARKILPL